MALSTEKYQFASGADEWNFTFQESALVGLEAAAKLEKYHKIEAAKRVAEMCARISAVASFELHAVESISVADLLARPDRD